MKFYISTYVPWLLAWGHLWFLIKLSLSFQQLVQICFVSLCINFVFLFNPRSCSRITMSSKLCCTIINQTPVFIYFLSAAFTTSCHIQNLCTFQAWYSSAPQHISFWSHTVPPSHPDNQKSSNSVERFKSHFKTYLFSKAFFYWCLLALICSYSLIRFAHLSFPFFISML